MVLRNSLLIRGRVFKELRRDYRSMFLYIASPSLVLLLLKGIMNHNNAAFDHYALVTTGLFPTAPTFLFVAFAIIRDRNNLTLEHLLTTPVSKVDVILGYIMAFITPAFIQVGLMLSVVYGLTEFHVAGSWWEIGLIALANNVLGMGVGLFATNFARNEFQMTKIIAMTGISHLILSGFFRPVNHMVGWMQFLAHFAPWRYGVSALMPFQGHVWPTAAVWFNLGVIAFILLLFFSISTFTILSRRTA
jgi:ABC-2 type transport system permease protein